ncbi:MAG TPA: methyltransferase domain-containing protein [Patescibacteria group bacterium]
MKKNFNNNIIELLSTTRDTALKKRAQIILQELDVKKGDKILDVGCGDGYYLHLISTLYKDVTLAGCDFDERGLASAKKNLKGNKIKLVKGDLMKKLPFPKNSFNKIVMSEVAEHLPNDLKGLSEVARVLKPGGTICLTVPNTNYPFFWDPVNWLLEHLADTHIKSGFWAGIWNQHERLYKPEKIRKIMEKAGFKVLKTETYTFWSLLFNHYLVNLGARILARNKNTFLTQGANKFKSESDDISFLPWIYFCLSEAVDSLNDVWKPRNVGVSVFVKASK